MTSDHLTNYCREKLSKPFKYLYFFRAVFIFYNLETKKILSRWISATRTSSSSSCSAPRRTPPMTATSSCTTFSSGEYYSVLTDYEVFILFICQTIFVFLVKRGLIRDLKPVNTHCVNSLKCWVSGVWPGDLTSVSTVPCSGCQYFTTCLCLTFCADKFYANTEHCKYFLCS